ncbi:putative membrane protein [Butyrivibrio sp. Su6]|uniref:hypothetical protein n=1 Tax=Butyrivibrio sp. Su6 TaxID=1520810 RepID=UPI00089E758C|nr:hypothetical protein [Butyrivibrio sp. Su6]SEG45016.1 putative membrane protein [Butyrivibrio sp. Su6]
MIRKSLMKSFSVIMAAMLAMMSVACGANTVTDETAAVETQAESEIEESMVTNSAVASSESEAGKVETVYVKTDANGAVNDVIVSEWLKNADASSEMSDTTELKDIVNVKGSETFTDNGDGTLTWNASGADIYYQGTTDKELPVDMKITYTLDGKEISPEELAGKSGRVTIRFDYENKEKQTVEVNGKEIEVYTPFAMVSGMMLDSDKFSNVEISNGKVISDGGNYVVMGVAVPGLKESLDIDDEKWEELNENGDLDEKLTNHFEVTADTTDFELGMTITMASSDILSDFGLTDLSDSDKLDDLKDDMSELNDGSTKLVDGSKELKDGTSDLRDGVTKLYDGTKELKDGTKDLKDGTGKLYDGTSKLYDGTGSLYDGTGSLKDGIVAYTDGASKINDGAGKIADGAGAAKSGADQLVNGMKAKDFVGNANKIAAGAGQVNDGVNTLIDTVNGTMKASVVEMETQKAQIQAALDFLDGKTTWNDQVAAGFSTISKGEVTDVYKATQIVSGKKAAEEQLFGISTQLKDAANQIDEGLKAAAQKQAAAGAAQSQENVSTDAANTSDTSEVQTETNSVTMETNDAILFVTADFDELTNPLDDDDTDDEEEDENDTEEKVVDENEVDDKEEESIDAATGGTTTITVEGEEEDNEELTNYLGASKVATGNSNVDLTTMLNATNGSTDSDSEKQIEELSKKIDELTSANADLEKSNQELQGKITVLSQNMQTQMTETATQLKGISAKLNDSASKLDESLPQGIYVISAYNQLHGAAESAIATIDLIEKKLSGSADLRNNAKVQALLDGTSVLASGTAEFAAGATTIYNGVSALDSGLGELSSGASQLKDGTSQLVENNGKLVDGASQLNDGAYQLKDGAYQLNDGARQLDDGAGKLNDGAIKLNDGVGELNDGAIKLDDGVQELLDGVIKLDEEGIKKLYEAFDGDLTEFADRMTAIKEAGESYTSFGGASEDVDSSVKFIIKTDAIKSL